MKLPGRELQAVDTNGGKIREGWSAADCDRNETASRMDWMWNSGGYTVGCILRMPWGLGMSASDTVPLSASATASTNSGLLK